MALPINIEQLLEGNVVEWERQALFAGEFDEVGGDEEVCGGGEVMEIFVDLWKIIL